MTQHPAYELFEELGRGTNTVVYRSYDLSLGREVAVKELDEAGRGDPRHRERFLREAQFLAQFEHDNVLRVYSVDPERGWIIMELMKGTLASVISAGPSDPDLVRSVLKQTLDALAFLHEKNKVHGTVRPTNLLINETGRVKLSEFEQTAAGGELRAPKGSKKYLAPELIRPEFGEFGPPLDLYCLGFAALEMLKGPQFDSLFPGTGKGAIDADLAWLRWHSSAEELTSVRKLVKGIPDDLAHVLDRMLKKRVADRPQSAQEVIKELADRPLIAVPVEGLVDDENAAAGSQRLLAPGQVRELSPPPQVVLPQGVSPVTSPNDLVSPRAAAAPAKPVKAAAKGAKGTSGPAKPVPPRFSKDWWNYQLGRPFVLYPLCALIILGALWFSFGRKMFGPGAGPRPVAVTFDVAPDAKGVEVAAEKGPIAATKEGKYELLPGKHSVTFRKTDFHPLTQEFEVSPERNKFAVKLEPVIKYSDVAVQVTPADAQVSVGGAAQTLKEGAYTHKLKEGDPLAIEVKKPGFVAVTRSFTAEELTKLGNKIEIKLEPEIKYNDVVVTVEPKEAQISIAGAAQTLKDGALTHKLKEGDTLTIEAKQDGFVPLSKSYLADELTKLGNKVSIKLEPEIKYVDIAIKVTPADAKLSLTEEPPADVDGVEAVVTRPKGSANGIYKHKLVDGTPFKIEVAREGYVTLSRNVTPAILKKYENKLNITLKKEKPKLPAALVAKPEAEIDTETQLPVRALSAKLGDEEPMEFVLVKPGTYKFGLKGNDRTRNELPERTVRIEKPFYMASHEATNAQYQRFFEDEGESKAGTRWQRASEKWTEAAKKWPEPVELDPVKNHLPVSNVSGEEAKAFSEWLGGRLPTEIEWESAVRGPLDKGFPFPWGAGEPTAEKARLFLFTAPILGPVQVEDLPKGESVMGLVNALGNVAEICRDSENPAGFVLRGASFTITNTDDLRVTWRGRGDDRGEEFAGVRVVVPVDDWEPKP